MWEWIASFNDASLVTQAITYTGIVASLSLLFNFLNFHRQRRLDKIADLRERPKFTLHADGGVWGAGWRHAVVDIKNPSDNEFEVKSISIRPRGMKLAPQATATPVPDYNRVSTTVSLKANNKIAPKAVYGDDVYWLTRGSQDSCRELHAVAQVQQTSFPFRKWKLKASVVVPEATATYGE